MSGIYSSITQNGKRMAKQSKRENVDVSPEQEAYIDSLMEIIKAPSRKDAILTAVRLTLLLAGESQRGNQIYLGKPGSTDMKRLLVAEIEAPYMQTWRFLIKQAHPWKQQLFVKGRKLSAATVWSGMIINKLSREQAAENWDLPIEAIDEIVAYCEENKTLLEMEALEERRLLAERGIEVEPPSVNR